MVYLAVGATERNRYGRNLRLHDPSRHVPIRSLPIQETLDQQGTLCKSSQCKLRCIGELISTRFL